MPSVTIYEQRPRRITELEDEDKDDVGLGSGAGALPPPPPPPHEIINRAVKAITDKFLIIMFQVKG